MQLFAQEVVDDLVRHRLAAQRRRRAGDLGAFLLLPDKQLFLAHLVEQIAVGIALVVEHIGPHLRQRIGQRPVHARKRPVAVVNLHGFGFDRSFAVGVGQLFERLVVGKVAFGAPQGRRLQLLGLEQRRVVRLGKFVAEPRVLHQVADLLPFGNLGGFRLRRLRRSHRTVEIGQHPVLLDGVDPVDQTPLGRAYLENTVLQFQNLVGELAALLRILAQLPPHPLHGMDHRILPYLQPGVLLQERHVLGIVLQARDAGLDGRLLGAHDAREKQRRARKETELANHWGYLHHLRKKS